MLSLETQVNKLTDSLVGTLDGRPGLMTVAEQALHCSRDNSTKLDLMSGQIDGLRLNWAKVTGIALAASTLLALVFKIALKI